MTPPVRMMLAFDDHQVPVIAHGFRLTPTPDGKVQVDVDFELAPEARDQVHGILALFFWAELVTTTSRTSNVTPPL